MNADFKRIQDAKGQPVEVTEELTEYALCVLPPVYGKGCFAMGEPYIHDGQGNPVYFWFATRAARCFALIGTQKEAEKIFNSNFVQSVNIKLKAVSIQIMRGECMDGWKFSNNDRSIILEGKDLWKRANAEIARYAGQIPRDAGYFKTDFIVTFEDLEEYRGTLDLKHPLEKNNDNDLRQHILTHLKFYVGEFCPDHMKQEEYQAYIQANQATADQIRPWLDNYSYTDDEPTPTPRAPLPDFDTFIANAQIAVI